MTWSSSTSTPWRSVTWALSKTPSLMPANAWCVPNARAEVPSRTPPRSTRHAARTVIAEQVPEHWLLVEHTLRLRMHGAHGNADSTHAK